MHSFYGRAKFTQAFAAFFFSGLRATQKHVVYVRNKRTRLESQFQCYFSKCLQGAFLLVLQMHFREDAANYRWRYMC